MKSNKEIAAAGREAGIRHNTFKAGNSGCLRLGGADGQADKTPPVPIQFPLLGPDPLPDIGDPKTQYNI